MKTFFTLVALSLIVFTGLAQNPYLPLWEHVPDGEPRVFEDPDNPDKMRAYIIGSHDVTYTSYCGPDIRMWSAPVEDLSQWRDEGPIFRYYLNGQWDTMFAPDIVEFKENGKKVYYLYPHSRGNNRVPMVCKGDRPNGPFTPVNLSPDGQRCLPGSMIDFDPSVFVENITDKKDPDYNMGFRAYAYYGYKHSTAAQLDQKTMYSTRPGTQPIEYFLPASFGYGNILDPKDTEYVALCKDQNPSDFNFYEASSIRQIGNKYVMVFSGFSGPDYGLGSTNSALRYCFGDTPLGPWRSGGVLVDSRGVVPNEDGTHLITTNDAHNTHGSLQQINGQWYVFYHRPPRGYGFARQAMVAPVKIEWDKKSVADGGQVRITGYDPYTKDNEWTASAKDGICYRGAEVTSEGFNIFGLPPYLYYSAGIACYMSDGDWLQDNFDQWRNGMDLTGIKNAGIVGFKYFGFGGLEKDTKGIKAFTGTMEGDGTRLCLQLTPNGKVAFRIRVMMDGPYANSTWKGKELGVIAIPAEAKSEPTVYTLAVPQVEGVKGKHAIYLIVEGPDVPAEDKNRQHWMRQDNTRPKGLMDLHGIGFESNAQKFTVPVEPKVNINVDGCDLVMNEKPIFFTNLNGYDEVNRYQIYGRLTDKSIIKVTVTDPAVQTSVSPINSGRAVVTCTYNGRKKIYLIN